MTDYNNGEIWGWNGGECPVHPKSEVKYWLRSGASSILTAGGDYFWKHSNSTDDIVCFQVTKVYVEPKVIWVNVWPNGEMLAYDTEEKAKMWSSNMHCRIAVKYVEAKE